MREDQVLRPIERRLRRLHAAGVTDAEVASRFRRSPAFVERVRALSEMPRPAAVVDAPADVLSPLQRRVLLWRESGASYPEIAMRFRRSPRFIRQVERIARDKLAP